MGLFINPSMKMIKKSFISTDKIMKKVQIIQRFIDQKITIDDACDSLSCSERTIYRYQATLRTEGPPGLIH
jgi:predicted DNA-binding transcriptional regulator YafY